MLAVEAATAGRLSRRQRRERRRAARRLDTVQVRIVLSGLDFTTLPGETRRLLSATLEQVLQLELQLPPGSLSVVPDERLAAGRALLFAQVAPLEGLDLEALRRRGDTLPAARLTEALRDLPGLDQVIVAEPPTASVLDSHKAAKKRLEARLKRETWEKVLAILVALAWSFWVGRVFPSTWLRVLVPAATYLAAWGLAVFLSGHLSHMHFEQFTLVMAELVAFLLRGASQALVALWVPPAPVEEHHPEGCGGHEAGGGTGEHERGGDPDPFRATVRRLAAQAAEPPHEVYGTVELEKYAIWAGGVLVLGVLLFGLSTRLRMTGLHHQVQVAVLRRSRTTVERRHELVGKAMADIDLDSLGLAAGYAIFAFFMATVAGPEWPEAVEERSDDGLYRLWWYLLGVGLAAACLLWILRFFDTNAWVASSSRYFAQAIAFAVGFMLDVCFSLWFSSLDSKVGGDCSEVTWRWVVYPLVMFSAGLGYVAGKRLRGGEGVIGEYRQVFSLAVQLSVALSFEGLFDRVLKSLHIEQQLLWCSLYAVGLSIMYMLRCHFAMEEDEDDHEREHRLQVMDEEDGFRVPDGSRAGAGISGD